MDRWVSDLIITVNALIIIGTFTLLGIRMKLKHDRSAPALNADDVQRLRDELDVLREESAGQIAELHERLDFAERLLAQRRIAPAEPRVVTPV